MAFPNLFKRLFGKNGGDEKLRGDIIPYGTEAPHAANKTASAGSANTVSRSDHVHPVQTTITGNSATATKLAKPVNITLTGDVTGTASFDGSADVSIATTLASMTIPLGSVIAFSGTFGGTSNRFPIPLGKTAPDTHWCLCDGIKTNNLAVPNLRDRFIVGTGTTYKLDGKGGAATHTHTLSGNVGATTLTVAQLAKHTHKLSHGAYGSVIDGNGAANWTLDSKATGESKTHTHALTNIKSAASSTLPPYYALAFIMKCA